GLTLLAGLVLPGLGQVLVVISVPFVRYTIRIVTWLACLPVSEVVVPDFHVLWLVVFYGVLFLLTLTPREARKKTVGKIVSPQVGLLVLTGLTFFVWSRVLSAPDGRLHMTLLDTQGTVLIQTAHGRSVLIGGGESTSALNQALGQMLPAGQRRLDLLIVGSAEREDLLGLLGVIKKVPIEAVLWGPDPETNQATRTVYALLMEKGVPVHPLDSGYRLDIGDGLQIKALWTGERGVVLWLAWGDFSALIPTGKVGDHWLAVPMPPSALFLPTGLGAFDLPLEQITAWAPQVILLPIESTKAPALQTVFAGYPLVTGGNHGWVQISTDGRALWVRTGK
ncbi:MAG: hypothetical protein GX142_07510, partial [Chloroflexi bacterium]|nr:hypothetical protein [Chloroflexota bacterium]